MNYVRLAAIVIASAVTLSLGASPGHALAQDEPKATTIELSAKPALDDHGHALDGQYAITAIVTTADGRYVGKRTVNFVENVEFFGQRSMQVGSAVTDNTGFAMAVYQPAQEGPHTIIARFGGDQQYAASDARLTLDATAVVPPFTTEPLPLASVGRWLAVSLAILGVAFWAVLLGVLGRTVWRIRTAAGEVAKVTAPALEELVEEVPI